jgi:Flavodoxin
MPAKIAVIYYSATGNVHMLAEAIAEGAAESASEVRLRRVQELASEGAIQQNQLWAKHRDETAGKVQEATLDDLEWADGYAFGTPVRFGNPAAQLGEARGNPYGTAFPSGGGRPSDAVLAAARHQGRRLTAFTNMFVEAGMPEPVTAD